MTFAQILPFACFAALPLLAGALWLLNRTGFLAAGTKHLFPPPPDCWPPFW